MLLAKLLDVVLKLKLVKGSAKKSDAELKLVKEMP